jgi:hypothetical protein
VSGGARDPLPGDRRCQICLSGSPGKSRVPNLRVGFKWGFLYFDLVLSRSNLNPLLIHAAGNVIESRRRLMGFRRP